MKTNSPAMMNGPARNFLRRVLFPAIFALFLLFPADAARFFAPTLLAQSEAATKSARPSRKGARAGKKTTADANTETSASPSRPKTTTASTGSSASRKVKSALKAAADAYAAAEAAAEPTAEGQVPLTAAEEALAAQAEIDAEAAAAEVSPELAEEVETAKKKGTVPDFAAVYNSGFNVETEDEYYNKSIQNRRDAGDFPVASLALRRYADYLVKKYDYNRDGKLQESEWSKMAGSPQKVDLNGDFILDESEILYYLARFAKDRTIFNPTPPVPANRRHVVLQRDRSVLIRPLSAPLKTETEEAAEKAKKDEGLADLTEDDLDAIVEETADKLGTGEDEELFDVVMDEMNESRQREYVVPREELRGLPVWFLTRDLNGDGQLSLREFAPGLSLDATAFFGKMDANSDGLITPEEVKAWMAKGGAVPEK